MRTGAQKTARYKYDSSEKGKKAKKRHDAAFVLSGGRAVVEQTRGLKPLSPARKAARNRWAKANKQYAAADRANRRRLAKFPLHPAFRAEIEGMYQFCQIFPGFEVDHVIPIKNAVVSGLHVPWNLQVIPRADNRRKGNKFNMECTSG